MARAPFSIFTRKGSDGKLVFCARFFGEDGQVIKTVTLRDAKSPTSAARLAEAKLRDGIVSNSSNPDAMTYFREFWKRDSDYVQGRALRGVTVSERYLYDNRHVIELHLSKHLKGRRLLDISPAVMERAVLSLSRAGVGARRINVALQAVKVPFAYYCKIHHLANPLTSVEKLAEKPKERGILTAEEVGRVVKLDKESPRVIAAVFLGALCGLRLGEVRGLQWDDVDEDAGVINVRHNFVDGEDDVKAPKWGSSRTVPAPASVLEALRLCADISKKGKSGIIIWNEKHPEKPIPSATIRHGFERVLIAIGISDAEKARRNLCFHGLRHTFVSLSRTGGLPDFVVQRLAGHKSMDMTNHYSHAEGVIDFAAARASMERAIKEKPKAEGGEKCI